MRHAALVHVVILLCLYLPMHGNAQSHPPYNLRPISPAAREFVQAGLSLARLALQDPDAMSLSQAKLKGLRLEQCTVEYKTLMGLNMFLRGCRSMRAPFVVVEMTTDASGTATLPAGLHFGMPIDQAIKQLGTRS